MDSTHATETADANPGEFRNVDEVTVTITVGRAWAIEILKRSDDSELAALLRNELYKATRA